MITADRWFDLWLFVLSLAAAGGGWYMRSISDQVSSLRSCVSKLAQQISADGVRGSNADDRLGRIEDKLDKVIDSLGHKVDRDDCLQWHRTRQNATD